MKVCSYCGELTNRTVVIDRREACRSCVLSKIEDLKKLLTFLPIRKTRPIYTTNENGFRVRLKRNDVIIETKTQKTRGEE